MRLPRAVLAAVVLAAGGPVSGGAGTVGPSAPELAFVGSGALRDGGNLRPGLRWCGVAGMTCMGESLNASALTAMPSATCPRPVALPSPLQLAARASCDATPRARDATRASPAVFSNGVLVGVPPSGRPAWISRLCSPRPVDLRLTPAACAQAQMTWGFRSTRRARKRIHFGHRQRRA